MSRSDSYWSTRPSARAQTVNGGPSSLSQLNRDPFVVYHFDRFGRREQPLSIFDRLVDRDLEDVSQPVRFACDHHADTWITDPGRSEVIAIDGDTRRELLDRSEMQGAVIVASRSDSNWSTRLNG